MKALNYIALFYPTEKDTAYAMEFDAAVAPAAVYATLTLPDYRIYQFIQHDYTFNMPPSELAAQGIQFYALNAERKTWFGLSRRKTTDLLIHPAAGFFYPYSFGHYLYIYTKEQITNDRFAAWVHHTFPSPSADMESWLGRGATDEGQLLHPDDYVLITGHDSQKDFAVTGKTERMEQLRQLLATRFDCKPSEFAKS